MSCLSHRCSVSLSNKSSLSLSLAGSSPPFLGREKFRRVKKKKEKNKKLAVRSLAILSGRRQERARTHLAGCELPRARSTARQDGERTRLYTPCARTRLHTLAPALHRRVAIRRCRCRDRAALHCHREPPCAGAAGVRRVHARAARTRLCGTTV